MNTTPTTPQTTPITSAQTPARRHRPASSASTSSTTVRSDRRTWDHRRFVAEAVRLVAHHGAAVAVEHLDADERGVPTAGGVRHRTLTVFHVWAVDRLLTAGLEPWQVLWHPLVHPQAPLAWYDAATLATPEAHERFVPSPHAVPGAPAPSEPAAPDPEPVPAEPAPADPAPRRSASTARRSFGRALVAGTALVGGLAAGAGTVGADAHEALVTASVSRGCVGGVGHFDVEVVNGDVLPHAVLASVLAPGYPNVTQTHVVAGGSTVQFSATAPDDVLSRIDVFDDTGAVLISVDEIFDCTEGSAAPTTVPTTNVPPPTVPGSADPDADTPSEDPTVPTTDHAGTGGSGSTTPSPTDAGTSGAGGTGGGGAAVEQQPRPRPVPAAGQLPATGHGTTAALLGAVSLLAGGALAALTRRR